MVKIARFVIASVSITSLSLAMDNTPFFNSNSAPSIAFNAKNNEWTLSNQAISKTIRFDLKSNGLVDQSGRSEGAFELVEDAVQTRELLVSGWKMSSAEPNENWHRPGFNDSRWSAISLPFKTDDEYKSWCYRLNIAGLTKQGKQYVLEFDQAVDDAAEVYADGKKVGELSANDQPWTKVCRISLPSRPSLLAIKLKGGGKPNGLGLIRLVELGESDTLDLSKGWRLVSKMAESSAGKTKTLTLGLEGIGPHAGYSVTVHYRVFPGSEPYIAKWFTLHNKNKRMVLANASYGLMKVPKGKYERYNGSGFAALGKDGKGVCAALFDLQGSTRLDERNSLLTPEYTAYIALEPGVTKVLPTMMQGEFQGSISKGAFLIKLFVGRYIAHSTPTSVPPVFNTWFGFYNGIDGETVKKIIPVASRIGCKVFVIDDGWQTNTLPAAGNYGDWLLNKVKFPMGMESLSQLARDNGMAFGLWFAPVMVGNFSKVATEHPDWLVKRADGSRLPLWDGTSAMCLTGSWFETFSKSILEKAKNWNLEFVKIDGTLFVDGCIEPSHGHPVSHSEGKQIENWKDLAYKLRQVNPNMIVDRGWESEAGVAAIQDEGWFGDWALAFRPDREADPKWWYKNADIYRRELYNLTSTRPGFTLCWEVPCHILAKPLDLNALEYHFTSIGAYICNVEIHGRLDLMTPEEEALIKKWIKWNWENRPWLAYAQPLRCLGQGYDPRVEGSEGKVDGVVHLRPLLKNRYGYICLWNSSEKAQTAKVQFDSQDSYVALEEGKVRMLRLKDGNSVPFVQKGSNVSLTVPMAPLSWEIIEVRRKQGS